MSSGSSAIRRPWICREVDETIASELARQLGTPEVVSRLLVDRGLTTLEEARAFLDPKWNGLHDPSELPDLEEAVDMILAVRDAGGTVGVFGDYDVDGISGSAILQEVFRHLGIQVTCRLPHRVREGYGLSKVAVEEFAEQEVDLIVTVDGGSNDAEAIQLAQELGLEVIVTDHHQVMNPSEGILLVHPDRPDQECLSVGLCGAGVAYKLAWAVAREAGGGGAVDEATRDLLIEMAGFASLGTVADVVPLTGENRIIVRHGLKILQSTRRPGLEALMDQCNIDRTKISSTDIGFRIAPHLNAAGRIDDATAALELLTTADSQRGKELAREMGNLNRRRKEIEDEMVEACVEEVEAGKHPEEGPLVFAREGWHTGVAGIVASRISERQGRPTWVLCIDGDEARGSGRGFPEWSLAEMYPLMEPIVKRVGGHAAAGGTTVAVDQIETLRSALLQSEADREQERDVPPRYYDGTLTAADLTMTLAEHLECLAPFGEGNREPVFRIEGLRLDGDPRLVGEQQAHIQAHFRGEGVRIPSIWFRAAGRAHELTRGGEVVLMARIGINDFRGRHLQLQIVDCLED